MPGGAGGGARRREPGGGRLRERLARLAGAAFEVEAEAVAAAARGSARAALARHVAIYLAHTGLGLSFTEAGRLFGRDRCTAAYACRQVEQRRDDMAMDRIVAALEVALRRGGRRATQGRPA